MASVSDSALLSELHVKAQEMFRVDPPENEYFPHLSLVYGDIPMDRRIEIRKEIRREMSLPVDIIIDRIQVWEISEGGPGNWKMSANILLD